MAHAQHDNAVTVTDVEPAGSLPTVSKPTLPDPDHCVICLDVITEKAVALPCRHSQFDFPCLGTWLQRQQVCPLCKSEVKAIRFNVSGSEKGDHDRGSKIFYLPPPHEESSPGRNIGALATRQRTRHARRPRRFPRGARDEPLLGQSAAEAKDTALAFRRNVYRSGLYSLHVGTNRISRYRAVTPKSFQQDEHLVSRARAFIRRELRVFEFLDPDSSATPTGRRRADNADFLLEYVISILKSIDLKGSTGQAEELLTDFLGRENARLFIHELQAWLRSPYEKLEDWDRNVQYAVPTDSAEPESSGSLVEGARDVKRRQLNRSSSPRGQPVPRWFSDRFVLGQAARATSRHVP